MSLSDAYVRVSCDCREGHRFGCDVEEEVHLTAVAQRGYDERNVAATLAALGWVVTDDGRHICPDCKEKLEGEN